MADNEVIIKINADAKSVSEAYENISKQTDDLGNLLEGVGKRAALAFAAFTAEIGLSVRAFGESERAGNLLAQSMKTQGIYSADLKEKYEKQANELQNLTGVADEVITGAQTTIQAFIGQKEVTTELTGAVLDFATAQKVDASSAAELFGKAINGNVAMLKRYGITIDENATKQERMTQLVGQVSALFGGQAEASTRGVTGALVLLGRAFDDVQKAIGARFAPIVESIARGLTGLFNTISQNKALVTFAEIVLALGATLAGFVTAISAVGLAMTAMAPALAAIGAGLSLITLPIALGIAGFAALAAGIVYLAYNWQTAWPKMQKVFNDFVASITGVASGFGEVLTGVFTLNKDKIKKGLDDIGKVYAGFFHDNDAAAKASADKQLKDQEEADKKREEQTRKANKAIQDQKELQQQRELDSKRANNEVKLLADEDYSEKTIALAKKRAEILAQIADENFKTDKAALSDKAADLNDLKERQMEQDLDQQKAFQTEVLANNEEYQAMDEEQKQLFLEQNQKQIQDQMLTEETSRQEAAKIRSQEQIESNNRYLLEQKKFGTAYATVNKIMHSEIYQGSKQAFGDLAELQQSSNSTLKDIGKVAAVANIIIKTAESAMNIYAGFSIIPFVGPALGIAGAAAAIAFGAEQVGKVTAAADGGLMMGGFPGRDSIPVLAQQGELISPQQNFEEVIGSVRAQREAEKLGGGGVAGSQNVNVTVGLDGREASQLLTIRQIQDRKLGISPEAST